MKRPRVTLRHSVEMATLYKPGGLSVKEICNRYPQYSTATVYRHAKHCQKEKCVRPYRKRGRPNKLNTEQCNKLIGTVKSLRETEGSFTSPRVAVKAKLDSVVSNRTIRRILNENGYGYHTTRRKGMLYARDFEARLEFCRKVRNRNLGIDFWTHNVSFYLDATGFQYKTNPLDQARTPRAREWRKKSEGLIATGKGKEGVVNSCFMVGISYNAGVVLCEKYVGSITGAKCAEIAVSSFPDAFQKSVAPRAKRVIQDGCPRQNSKVAKQAYESVLAKVMVLPPRSPDLNPIENFFNLVKRELRQQAIDRNITYETLKQFNTRVEKTLKEYSVDTINRLIASMDKRITMVIEAEGRRIRY